MNTSHTACNVSVLLWRRTR